MRRGWRLGRERGPRPRGSQELEKSARVEDGDGKYFFSVFFFFELSCKQVLSRLGHLFFFLKNMGL